MGKVVGHIKICNNVHDEFILMYSNKKFLIAIKIRCI